MSCIGCNQAIIEANAQKQKTIDEAQRLANEQGAWYAIYPDEYGAWQIIRYDLARGAVIRIISPKL